MRKSALSGPWMASNPKTLWLFRDLLSGRMLLARNLLSSRRDELASLLAEIKQIGVPIRGVVSDEQASPCLAIEKELPEVPHQLCQFQYLREAAQPVCEADRKLKKTAQAASARHPRSQTSSRPQTG